MNAGSGGRRYGTSVYTPNGTAGTKGTYFFFDGKNLVVPTNFTYVMTSAAASTIETIVVENGGNFALPEGLDLSLTSYETQSGGKTNLSSNVTAGTVTLDGGRVNAPNVTLKSTGNATVTRSTTFSGKLEVGKSPECHIKSQCLCC